MANSEKSQKSFQVFQNIFSELQDPRRQAKGNFSYSLNEILFLTISAVVSGMDNWISISNFGKIKQDWLRNFLPYKAGIPSHDILGDIFAKINPVEFSTCFTNWVNTLWSVYLCCDEKLERLNSTFVLWQNFMTTNSRR
jgi:DDE_Tnp_1-associated